MKWFSAFAVLLGACIVAAPANAADARPPVRHLLVVSLGTRTWQQLDLARAPVLRTLLEGSAIADLSVHANKDVATLRDGYVTVGAGARAEDSDEAIACTPAFVCPGQPAIKRHNDTLLFDARVGLLGETLAKAHVTRAAVGDPDAALALADRNGNGVAAFDGWHDREVVVYAPARLEDLESSLIDGADAVLVVSPGQEPGAITTTVAALRAPGLQPGLLRSPYTGRDGVVATVDIAPTILDQFGIERPAHMEGRAMELGRPLASFDRRLHWVIETNQRAQFRDRAITWAAGIFLACAFVLAGLATVWWRTRRVPTPPLQIGALALLYFLPLTYVASFLPFARWGLGLYFVFVGGTSAATAFVTYACTRGRPIAPIIASLSAVAGLIVVDVVSGSHLQFNGTFGYSPTIGGRFAGLGNQGYAMLAAATVLLAGLVAYELGTRAGWWVAAALFGVTIVVDGAPAFGADIGGVLSMVPAFAITAVLLSGRRVRARVLAWSAAGAVALLGLFAAFDLSRAPDRRTHLGRLLSGNGSDFVTVIHRKIAANLDVVTSTPVTWILPVVYVAVAYVVYRSPGPLRIVRDKIPQMNAALAGLGVVALLGTALNDSGIAITGIMFGVLTPVLVLLSIRVAAS